MAYTLLIRHLLRLSCFEIFYPLFHSFFFFFLFVSSYQTYPLNFSTKEMQTSMYDDESQSIFVFRNPLRFLSRKGRQIGAYLSGGLVKFMIILGIQ